MYIWSRGKNCGYECAELPHKLRGTYRVAVSGEYGLIFGTFKASSIVRLLGFLDSHSWNFWRFSHSQLWSCWGFQNYEIWEKYEDFYLLRILRPFLFWIHYLLNIFINSEALILVLQHLGLKL